MEDIHNEIYKITGAATYINESCNILMETYKAEVHDLIDSSVKGYFAVVLQGYQLAA